MIRIIHKKKEYLINKEKIIFILAKLSNKKIKENEIEILLKKYHLLNEHFLENLK